MGDWAVAAFEEQGKEFGTDYIAFPVPGTDGVFDFLADSFTLPVGAPEPGRAPRLAEDGRQRRGPEGVQQGQGLHPGQHRRRTRPTSGQYQQTAIESSRATTIVSSLAHGAAAPVQLADAT